MNEKRTPAKERILKEVLIDVGLYTLDSPDQHPFAICDPPYLTARTGLYELVMEVGDEFGRWKATPTNLWFVRQAIESGGPLLDKLSDSDRRAAASLVNKARMAVGRGLPRYKLPDYVWVRGPNSWVPKKQPDLCCVGDLWIITVSFPPAQETVLMFTNISDPQEITRQWDLYGQDGQLRLHYWLWSQEVNVSVFRSGEGFATVFDEEAGIYLMQKPRLVLGTGIYEVIKAVDAPYPERNCCVSVAEPAAYNQISALLGVGVVVERYLWGNHSVWRLQSTQPDCAPYAWVFQSISLSPLKKLMLQSSNPEFYI